MKLDQAARSVFLKEFVAAFWLAMKYFFAPKATINYPFESNYRSPRLRGELAEVRLVTHGHAGDLEVAHAPRRQVAADLHGHVALDDLAVVQVHLHLHVGLADLVQQLVRVVLAIEEEAWDVARVDRLHQQLDARARGLFRGPAQVGHVGRLQRGALLPLRHQPRHHVHARAGQRLRVAQRVGDALAEFGLAPCQAGQPAFPAFPVAGRRVEQHLLEPMVA